MTRWRRHPEARATELDGEAFLVRQDRDAILHLNPTATALWRALAEPASRDDLIDIFALAYPDEPAERLTADLDRALAALAADDMVATDDG
ncbi:PqqD family protein [Thalassobaculum sp.]|uniref:PqqD family protein n=1 Tax=Thalassobaculum sp. TaxID=2022740 RepID=UPI0032EE66EE